MKISLFIFLCGTSTCIPVKLWKEQVRGTTTRVVICSSGKRVEERIAYSYNNDYCALNDNQHPDEYDFLECAWERQQ